MRYFTIAVALTVFCITGFTPDRASANCHEKIEAVMAKLDKIPESNPKREKIAGLIAKANKFKDDKKKKKKCGNLVKKANKQLKQAMKQGGGSDCTALIEQAEAGISGFAPMGPKVSKVNDDLVEARNFLAEGKQKECIKVAKRALKKIN
ncbi:MAG: hypothetical protein ISR51_00405 [Rhodospirillales bacterium]|nr:hypothetical protein [Alphaproteobacteria bacterium]MBL6947111.1 hypothetical protein [Rhodospirillales bacterium]